MVLQATAQAVGNFVRKRRTRSNLQRLSKSATKIQAFTRGSLTRKRIQEEQAKQNAATKQLKAVNRKMSSKRVKRVRKKRTRSSLRRLSKSATKIQAFVRGSLVRKQLAETQQGNASSTSARSSKKRLSHLRRRVRTEQKKRSHSTKSRRGDDDDEDEGNDHSMDPLSQSAQTWHASLMRQHNLITIFQAAPLALLDANGDPRRVKRLDLHFERETITNALRDSNVSVDFEIAQDDQFGKFLGKGTGRAIHVSCHGEPTFLAFEDGWGQLQYIELDLLKEWIKSAGSNLEFVFVSACNSYQVGKIFADAGVPHVVCCHKETTLLDSAAAVKFTKALYHALAWGQPLKKAFELAQRELEVYPSFQASQFCLLPENGNHDVPIFSPDVQGAPPPPMHDTTPLPSTTDFFVRNDLEVYRTIQAIRDWRFVRVHGPEGIGKETLVRECCQYLRDRQKVVNLEEIVWMSVTEHSEETIDNSILAMCFQTVFKHWRSRSGRTASAMTECRKIVTRTFHDKRALLVIEAKHLEKRGVKKMFSFLNRLLQGTNYLKVVVIYGAKIKPENMGELPGAYDISVDSLNIWSTIQLFATLCKHIPNPKVRDARDLWSLLSPKNQSLGSLTKRQAAILGQLGGSNPKEICKTAGRITEDEFETLVELGTYQHLDLFGTHAELMLLAFEFERRIALRKAREDSDGVAALDRKLRAVKLLKREFQDANKLTSLMKEKLIGLLQAENDEKDSWFAKHDELQHVESLIRKEEEAIVAWLADSRSSLFNTRIRKEQVAVDEKRVYSTGSPRQDSGPSSMAMDLKISFEILRSRHGIESCIRLLENHCNTNVRKAAAIEIHLNLLRELLRFKMATSELEAWKSQIVDAFSALTNSEKFEQGTLAEKLLDRFQLRIMREGKSKKRGEPRLATRRGVIEIAFNTVIVPMRRPPVPPLYTGISLVPKKHPLVAKNRRRSKEILSRVDVMLKTLESRPNRQESMETQSTAPVSISSMSTY